jgi:hypothetical protein
MIYRELFESDYTIFYQGKKEVIKVTTIRLSKLLT